MFKAMTNQTSRPRNGSKRTLNNWAHFFGVGDGIIKTCERLSVANAIGFDVNPPHLTPLHDFRHDVSDSGCARLRHSPVLHVFSASANAQVGSPIVLRVAVYVVNELPSYRANDDTVHLPSLSAAGGHRVNVVTRAPRGPSHAANKCGVTVVNLENIAG
jgi:hypothetical protein